MLIMPDQGIHSDRPSATLLFSIRSNHVGAVKDIKRLNRTDSWMSRANRARSKVSREIHLEQGDKLSQAFLVQPGEPIAQRCHVWQRGED